MISPEEATKFGSTPLKKYPQWTVLAFATRESSLPPLISLHCSGTSISLRYKFVANKCDYRNLLQSRDLWTLALACASTLWPLMRSHTHSFQQIQCPFWEDCLTYFDETETAKRKSVVILRNDVVAFIMRQTVNLSGNLHRVRLKTVGTRISKRV